MEQANVAPLWRRFGGAEFAASGGPRVKTVVHFGLPAPNEVHAKLFR